jgi:DNA-directed RNA polymerase omega subunit
MFDKNLYHQALKKIPQRYLLVNLLSIRVRQLQKGQEPLVDMDDYDSPMDIALKEICEEKITVKYLEQPPTLAAKF